MAKQTVDTDRLCRELLEDVRKGIFKPVYLLMGDEPYYIDLLCDAIVDNCIEESERDFNQIICYGADTSADAIITAARRYPMFASRQLVVVKEAQMLRNPEDLAPYVEHPLDSTVFVICLRGAKADKRRPLYKAAVKNGVVLESNALRIYQLPSWVMSYYSSKGLSIDPDAASLLAEYVGTEMSKIDIETAKMLKNLPQDVKRITVADIENNIGISRQFTIFELTNVLGAHNAPKSLRIAHNVASAAKFAMPMAVATLFSYFYRLLRFEAALAANPGMSDMDKASLLGVPYPFVKDYDMATKFYPMKKCMAIVSMLADYDYKGKGGDGETATAYDSFIELITKILNI